MKRRRKRRLYEYTCNCGAYGFPHRMFGGDCDGSGLIEDMYPQAVCRTCTLNRNGCCEVLTGQEDAIECLLLQDFVAYNEIRLPVKWR